MKIEINKIEKAVTHSEITEIGIQIISASLETLAQCGVTSMPIQLVPIAKHYGLSVKAESSAKALKPKEKGKLILFNPPVIVIDDSLDKKVQRFTLAHEIGHWVLGHLESNAETPIKKSGKKIEREAEEFALELLAPFCVIKKLGLKSPEEIAEVCNISLEDATTRYNTMSEEEKLRNNFSFLIENEILSNFSSYIENFQKRRVKI